MSYRLEVEPEEYPEGYEEEPIVPMPPERRPWALWSLVGLAIVAGFSASVWTAYRIIEHHAAGAPLPVIHADTKPVKVVPANPGGLEVPDQDKFVLNRERPPDSHVEQLLPPPEAPLPRPATTEAPSAAAPAVVVAMPAPPAAKAAPPAVALVVTPVAPAAAPPPAAAPAEAPATVPRPTIVAEPASVASVPAPVVKAPPAIEPPPAAKSVAAAEPSPAVKPVPAVKAPPIVTASAGGAFHLQVGAVRTPEAAQTEWTRLKKAEPDLLGVLSGEMVRVDLGARGVFYRIQAGPIAEASQATHACAELKRRKVGCLVVKR